MSDMTVQDIRAGCAASKFVLRPYFRVLDAYDAIRSTGLLQARSRTEPWARSPRERSSIRPAGGYVFVEHIEEIEGSAPGRRSERPGELGLLLPPWRSSAFPTVKQHSAVNGANNADVEIRFFRVIRGYLVLRLW
jgi:hypothetical protein